MICGVVKDGHHNPWRLLTIFHHDVSGAVTFGTPRSGEKRWGIIKVKGEHSPDNRVDLSRSLILYWMKASRPLGTDL